MSSRSALVVLALLAFAACGKPAMTAVAPAEPEETPGERALPEYALSLPEGIALEGVRLRLRVDPGEEGFTGEARLSLRVDEARTELFVHADSLALKRVWVEREGGRILARAEETSVAGVMRVRLAGELPPGRATLGFEYRAAFSDSLEGLYVVKDGAGRYALTQLQPIAARRVFPGFDQMRTRAPYELVLEVPERMIAVANTAELARRPLGEGFDEVIFAPTPPLPSYLLAFAVGPFDRVDGPELAPSEVRDEPIALRGLATRGRGIELRYALSNVEGPLGVLESYFGRGAPVSKLDLLAAPDFWAGAMENPGLFFFRDSILLLPREPDVAARRTFALVVAHELAHLWLGNLVTPASFDDIWLNEAFATHLSYRALEAAHPEHRAAVLRAKSENRAKEADSLPGAKPVRRPVETVHDVKSVFDAITYEKGAALLRAYEAFLGEEALRSAVVAHVEESAQRTTDTEAFLGALAKFAPAEVVESLRVHLARPGVPEVSVQLRCDERSASIRLVQHPAEREPYPVAMCLRVDGERSCLLFAERESELDLARCPERLEPNAEGAGYFRSVLEGELFERYLARSLGEVDAAENIDFFGDATARFRSGRLSLDRYFALLEALGASRDDALVALPLEPLRFMYDEVAEERDRALVEARLRALYVDRFAKLGFEEGRSEEENRTRVAIGATILGRVDAPSITEEAIERARALVGYGARVDPDALAPGLRIPALALAIEAEGAPLLEELMKRFRTTVAPSERAVLLRAIGSVEEAELSARALELVFDPAVRKNEVMQLLGAQLSRRATRGRGFSFLLARWQDLVQKLGPSTAGSLASLAAYACHPEEIATLKGALEREAPDVPGAPRFLEVGLERARACVDRVARERAALESARP